MSDELKPCPFCGSNEATIEPVFGASFDIPRYCVICSGCGADSQVDLGQSGATECWNTRPIEDALRAENERLRAELSWYADEKNYREEYYEDERCDDSMVMVDRGERARNALKGGE